MAREVHPARWEAALAAFPEALCKSCFVRKEIPCSGQICEERSLVGKSGFLNFAKQGVSTASPPGWANLILQEFDKWLLGGLLTSQNQSSFQCGQTQRCRIFQNLALVNLFHSCCCFFASPCTRWPDAARLP
ncbi:unnamed protein product [Durusdinium trenchii]|uniref:Uncharacterized protein n=1 Tax=Durusdinium trenchii TaxID=1381693 RepID=A0ABP0NZ25_9DINO